MCGIVGLLRWSGAPIDPERLERAALSLRRRGPDDAGLWIDGPIGLGHRRLSIIDLSPTGRQPMFSADGRYVIVFNGEVYNFLELRQELDQRHPHAWRSMSDTEVILKAYAAWGPACVERFHGMFAFTIWDKTARTLFAARDRMGVKPFYYHQTPAGIAFASRPRAIRHLLPELSRDIDVQALRYYLEAGYVPAPYSIYTSIRKLPPAHFLFIDETGTRLARYWDPNSIKPEPAWEHRREEDLLDELDEIVSRCVRSRLVSDVPLGAFLSGGIDSSLVVAMMAKHSSEQVKTFTIGFEEQEFDESRHALAVAKHIGTDHRSEILCAEDVLQLVPTFLEEFDEPFYDSSAFSTMAVSRLARRYVTVSLSGDGGDELFGGYHYYRIIQALHRIQALPLAVRELAAGCVGMIPQHRFKLLMGAIRQPDHIAAYAFIRGIAKDFANLLHREVLGRTTGLAELFGRTASTFPHGLTAAECGMRIDLSHTLTDDYLQKVDVSSMAFSLESRDPLLDQDLVEWAMHLPLGWKVHGKTDKYLLRKLTYRYVPRELLDRPKRGFAVPIDSWLRGPLRAWAEERIENKAFFRELPLDQQTASALWKLHLAGGREVHPLLWALLCLLEFFEQEKSILG